MDVYDFLGLEILLGCLLIKERKGSSPFWQVKYEPQKNMSQTLLYFIAKLMN